MTMKMPIELYTELEQAIRPHMHINSANTMRQRWDTLWVSKYPVNKLYNAGLNDDHIDTALRHIFAIGD